MEKKTNNISGSNVAIDKRRQEAISLARLGNITGAIALAKSTLKLDPTSKLLDELSELYLSLNPELTEPLGEGEATGKSKASKNTIFPKTPLFSSLPELELMEVINAANHVTLEKDKEVFSADDDGRSIFVITSGSANVVCTDQEGLDITCATLNKGDFFGEFGYFGEKRRTASVMATSQLELLELKRTDLRLLIDSHHSIGDRAL